MTCCSDRDQIRGRKFLHRTSSTVLRPCSSATNCRNTWSFESEASSGSNLLDNHVFVKLDFFECIQLDKKRCRFNSRRWQDTRTLSICSQLPGMQYHSNIWRHHHHLAEGSQQGNPLSGLKICESSRRCSKAKHEPWWDSSMTLTLREKFHASQEMCKQSSIRTRQQDWS